VLAAEHPAKLELGEHRVGAVEERGGLAEGVWIALLTSELIKLAALLEHALAVVDVADDLFEGGLLAQLLLRPIVVGPKARVGRGDLELF